MVVLIALLSGCGGSGGAGEHRAIEPDPVLRARAVAVADTWIADHPATQLPWDWGEGVLTFGLLELARATGESRFQDYVREYVRYHDAQGLTYAWNDHLTPALSAAILLQREGGSYPEGFDAALTYIFEEAPRTRSGGLRHLGFLPFPIPAELWVDSLFHFVPLLGRAYLLDPQSRYLDEAAAQLVLFATHMQDPATDLFTHAWSDEEDRQIPSFEAGLWWARGNGWAIAAMVDLLSILPPAHPHYAAIRQRCVRLEAALRRAQAADGRYHTVLLDDTTYLETAGSGLITYARARGVHAGLFGAAAWEAAQLGMQGLQQTLLIDEETGRIEVTGTSLGTAPVASLYRSIPTDKQVSYGVGAWLLAAIQFF
jgi:unsaturated rhamnogalacturonyl hydrolase